MSGSLDSLDDEFWTGAPTPEEARRLLGKPDQHGNVKRQEGVDRCYCGCKYWEDDRCIDCGGTVPQPVED